MHMAMLTGMERAMAEANWKRLKQSQVMDYGGELPARVVIEHDASDLAYRTCLDTVSADGRPASLRQSQDTAYKGMRFFYWEAELIKTYFGPSSETLHHHSPQLIPKVTPATGQHRPGRTCSLSPPHK
jgi:hypothetical protein